MDEIIIVGGLIEKDGKILLVNAKVGVPKGLWNLPSGHVEEGETVQDASVREAEEETGFRCSIEGFVGFYQRIADSLKKEKNIVRPIYKLKIEGGKLSIPKDEIEEARWFSKEEIIRMPENKFASATKEAALDYFERGFLRQSAYTIKKKII